MDRIKMTFQIIFTNWVHLLGFYFTTYLSFILFSILRLEGFAGENWNVILFFSPLAIPILFFTYGLFIIGGFYISICLLDTLAFNFIKEKTWTILFLEWIMIIPIFIMWAFEYEYWLWLTLILSFLVTQRIRKNSIEKIKNRFCSF
ncbi:hypothetical protein SAMN04488519_103109 [Algoriphagus ornithinivorans]|uniref:Uncharacterized protein n=1 Tax=Algoriphagus ornithinivorans TaxID=226506 RepID=A0A1I5DQM0_9BACT|nr:hypothetical protein SAMN04488519_103109 [Algoriphagus ornithinivorans]